MRRRSFIATLPLAATTSALAADAPGRPAGRGAGVDAWTDVPAAAVVTLAATPSHNVRITGKQDIRSFGEAPDGLSRTVRFSAPLVLAHNPASLILPNNGLDLFVEAGDIITAVALGGSNWLVSAYQPARVFAKLDRRPSKGGASFKLAIGADAGTAFPDFAVDGAYDRVKTSAKSIILGDPQDTTEIGAIAASGTPAAPGVPTGYAPHHINYSYAPHLPLDFGDVPGVATYNGRFAQEYFFQLETPTAKARGGGIAWGVTMPGQLVPYDRMWLRNYGLVLPGRAAFEDSGVHYGYNYGAGSGGAQSNYHHIFAPGPVNWGDVAGWGNLSLVASDESTGCAAIAIRKNGALETGHDLMYAGVGDELRLHTVRDGVRTPRWGIPVDGGHLLPVAARTVDVGSPARPVRTVHADSLDVRQAGRTPAAVFHSARPDLAGGLISLSADRPAGAGFNFLRATSGPGDSAEAVVEIDGAGHAAIAGALSGDGLGAGACLEWADGNPSAEDRVGWTVVMEGRKIRRATPADPPAVVIGVITARAQVVGDAAWRHWAGKHLADDFGRPLTRPVEHLRWREPVTEVRQVERTRRVAETVSRPRLERVEVMERIPRLEQVGDRWVERMVETRRTVERPATMAVPVHDAGGLPLTDDCGVPRTAEVPVHEQAEIERTETFLEPVVVEVGVVEHCHPAHAIPAGLVVPADAERLTLQERIPNPDFDPALPYAPRRARREWDVVSFCGPERVRAGERVGERWIRMGAVSDAVEEWLVR